MPDLRVTVYHQRGAGRRARLVRVYGHTLPAAWAQCDAELLAESLFWTFHATDPAHVVQLGEADRDLNQAYRSRRLRPLSRGDVLVVAGQAFACGSWGRAIPTTVPTATKEPARA